MKMLPTRFISSYGFPARADYGVYIRRLDRDIRVTRDHTGVIICTSGEVTLDENMLAVASVRAFLNAEHIKFLTWAAEKGISIVEG